MSKEQMKLILEALESLTRYDMVRANIFRQFHPTATGDYVNLQEFREKTKPLITALREALAKPDFWEGYVPEPVKLAQCAPAEDGVCEALDCSNHKPAQQEFVLPGGGYVPAIPAQQRPIKTFHGGKAWPVQKPAQRDSNKPVAGLLVGQDSDGRYVSIAAKAHADTLPLGEYKLYTSPPAQQEPVAWRVKVETKLRDGSVDVGYQLRNEKMSKHDEPLYTSPQPAQRTWVGLTDEEVRKVNQEVWGYVSADHSRMREIARAIEAAHGIKENT